MSNWFIHSLSGAILAIICIMLYPNMDPTVMCSAVIATVLGSIIPDIDHPKSKVRNVFRSLMLIGIISAIYLFVSNIVMIDFSAINQTYSNDLLLVLISFSVSLFIAVVLTTILETFIPRHRGSVHRIFAGLAYAVLIFIISLFYGFTDPLFISFWGFLGFLAHLIVDNLF